VCGIGPNFQFYPTATNNKQQQQLSITGLEPNPAMWQYTQQAAEAAGLGQQQLQLVAADAQQMPFDGNSFDAAVVTLVGVAVIQCCSTAVKAYRRTASSSSCGILVNSIFM
jgi:ubiquinone/menaquinone biosynthesis C-methylase UbiE